MESKHSREDETPERKPSLSRKSTADDDCEAPAPAPEVVALRQGYNQTYVVRSGGGKDNSLHDVLFRCGNWCYGGQVDLGGSRLELADVPVAIPALQKQQASLQYLGEWKALPTTSPYSAPLATLYDALDFMGAELASSRIEHKLMTAADEHAWIDADPKGSGSGSSHFFELQTSGFSSLDDSGIDFAASKTFVRGLVLLVVYYQRSFYVVLQDGDGEQPLLDVRFPDMSTHLQGVHLQTYHQEDGSKRGTEDIAARVKKLTLWQAGDGASGSGGKIASPSKPLKVQCKDVSGGGGYTQTFLIRRSSSADKTNNLREVLFRFGNWCYNGHVDLGPKLELADIPVIIPMLRRQQSALTFMCEVGKMPATSLFTSSMEHLAELVPALQGEISKAEQFVRALASSKDAGAAARVTEWLEDDDTECFFEIGVDKCPALQNVEAIASKVYLGGVVLVVLYYDYTFYVYLENGEEEQPLLDTTFPDISFQKEGMQLKTYRGGVPGCPELRRLSIWKVVLDMMDDSDGEEGGVRVSNASLAASGKGSSDRLRADSKQMERRREEDVKSPGEDGNKPTNNSSPSKPEARKTALPHHIAPLKQPNASGSATLKKIPDLGLKAPWDETGRPLGLRASK